MATLQSVLDRAISFAVTKGLSSSNRITVVYVIDKAEVMFVVSYTEPSSIEAPLNVIWINGNPAHPDYKKALKRVSRVASSGFTHTWNLVTEYSNIATQFWDTPAPSDLDHVLHGATLGNPHGTTAEEINALSLTGGQLTGPLLLKTGTTLEDFTEHEAVTRWWVNAFLLPIQTLASQVKQAQASMYVQINSIRNRVTTLENRLRSKGYVHTQVVAATEWVVLHNLNSSNMNISIYDSDGNFMLTDIYHIDKNSVKITFAVETSGSANLQAVVI